MTANNIDWQRYWQRMRRQWAITLLIIILLFMFMALVGVGVVCGFDISCNGTPGAELTAKNVNVNHQPSGGIKQPVLLGTPCNVYIGDMVDVDRQVEALLRFQDYLEVRIFRDSDLSPLEVEGQVIGGC